MNDDNNDRLHERLAALRRVTVKRGATKEEAETAKRLADQLAKRLGKKSRKRSRKRSRAVLPEPPQWRRKRLWLGWLEAALEKIAWAGMLLHGLWVASLVVLIVMLVVFVFGGVDMGKQFSDFWLTRSLILIAAALLLMVCAGVLAVAAWWLRTLPGERLRSAVLWLGRHLTAGLIAIAAIIAGVALDRSLGEGWLGYICFSFVIMPAACALVFVWYVWAHPLLERKLRSIWRGPSCKFGRTT
jgi:hypothetical protein